MMRAWDLREGLKEVSDSDELEGLVLKYSEVFPTDFLEETFWNRLSQIYLPFLKVCHVASQVTQRAKTPVLSCIPLQVHLIEQACASSIDDSTFVAEFKRAFSVAVTKRLKKFVAVNVEAKIVANAIKAALLDPRYSAFVQNQHSPDEIQKICNAIVADTLHLFPTAEHLRVIQKQMDVSFPLLLSKLQSAPKLKAEEVLPWWKTLFAEDSKTVSLWQNFRASVRLFLSMPAGGAPSEVVFSDTTGTVTKKRNQIGHHMLEQVTVLRNFIKSDQFDMERVLEMIGDQVKDLQEAAEAEDSSSLEESD